MKILVITDSLGLPRDKPEYVNYNEAWTNMFSKDIEVHKLFIGGGVVQDFVKQIVYVKLFLPDIVILQIGIVDCAPRALTLFENDLINKFYFSRKLAEKLLPKYTTFLRKKRQISYTSTNNFKKGLKYIKSSFGCKVYCIGIVPPSHYYEEYIYGIKKKVNKYNQTLVDVFKNEFIDISCIKEEMIMSDNIHLNKNGHIFIFNKIMKIINL